MPNQYTVITDLRARRWGNIKQIRMGHRVCWMWLGAKSRNGYPGVFWTGHRPPGYVKAHRFAYCAAKGPIPDGLTLDHLCRVRCCVNPAHLEAVDNRTNILRGTAPSAVLAVRTHCGRGHLFDEANTYHRKDGGGRGCKVCRRIWGRASWRRHHRRSA